MNELYGGCGLVYRWRAKLFHRCDCAGRGCFHLRRGVRAAFHLANESGVAFIAAGHHATERYGICALGDWLAEQGDLRVTYLEFDNPV